MNSDESLYRSIRGMEDILPGRSEVWRAIEGAARGVFASFGFREIIPPIVENTAVFARTLGDASDIVNKEMYTFPDRKGRSLTLRPEGTASVARAVIENNLLRDGGTLKLYYTGPMFRYERPQAGRRRQFFQIGGELLGSDSIFADADVLLCMTEIFRKLDIPVSVRVNTLGCQKCSAQYTDYVRETLTSRADLRENLCEDCVKRLGANVLRVFDCKNEVCRAALKQLIPIGESVCEKDKDDFSAFQRILSEFRVDFRADSSLVRGLDYYTGIVYEVYIKGRSDAVAGGGRYDNLIQVMGGPPTPAAGFAIGVDRIADFVSARGQGSEKTRVFLVSLGREALAKNFRLLSLLRQKGIAAQMEYSDKSPKAQFRRANSCGAAFTVIRGDEEIQKSIVKLKDMSDGSEKELKEEDVCSVLQKP